MLRVSLTHIILSVCALSPLLWCSVAQEDPKNVYLWWEHEEFGHRDLIDRLKRYSARLESSRRPSSPTLLTNPLMEVFDQTNTHAFVIHGPHPIRAENIRNFSKALGFTESGGKYLTKIYTVLGRLNMKQRKELWANGTAKYHQGSKWVGRYMTVKAHMNALQTFLNSNYTNAVIFEDDVMKTSPFSWSEVHNLMADMIALPSSDWDVQYLGSCYSEPFEFHYKENKLISPMPTDSLSADKYVYFRALNAFCLHAMVYNRVAAEVFLTKWMPFREAVDTLLSEIICKYGLKAIRPAVPILHQDRTLTKSSARNRDPLFVFKHKRSYVKWYDCCQRYNLSEAEKIGRRDGPAVPPIAPKPKYLNKSKYSGKLPLNKESYLFETM